MIKKQTRNKPKPTKKRNRIKLIEYIGNPENDFPNRAGMSQIVLGYKSPCNLYDHFTTDELIEIENEALEIRRTRYASWLSRVDIGQLKRAAEGGAKSAKLMYQRFENWKPTETREVRGDIVIKTMIPEPGED